MRRGVGSGMDGLAWAFCRHFLPLCDGVGRWRMFYSFYFYLSFIYLFDARSISTLDTPPYFTYAPVVWSTYLQLFSLPSFLPSFSFFETVSDRGLVFLSTADCVSGWRGGGGGGGLSFIF